MAEKEPHSSNKPNAKIRKLNNESDQISFSEIMAAVNPGAAVNQEQTADIFKLDIDCFEESFDYLHLKDLVSIGKTCKRLQQVAGYCFEQNYSNHRIDWCSKGVLMGGPYGSKINFTHFAPFFHKIEICFSCTDFFVNSSLKFHRLKEIEMVKLDFAKIEIDQMFTKTVLSKLQVLSVQLCDLSDRYQEIIDHCTELKRLKIIGCVGRYNGLDCKYSKLDYLQYRPPDGGDSSADIATFLKHNPSIEKLATEATVLWENRHNIIEANIQLDELALKMDLNMYHYSTTSFESLRDWLNDHQREHGLFTKLQLYGVKLLNQECINQLATVSGLVKITFHYGVYSPSFDFSLLKSLEEIYIGNFESIDDEMANGLIHLKRIHLRTASIDTIMLIILRSVKIQRIKVYILQDGLHFDEDTGIIDLLKLNKKRAQLPESEKITLYVHEWIYLATKWAMKETDLALIRLKRIDSFEWDHDDFEYMWQTKRQLKGSILS